MGIKQFVENILSDDSNKKKSFHLGKVTVENAKLIEKETGLDVKDYIRTIDNYAIKHIKEKHGNPNIEKKRGQVAIIPQDYENIKQIVEKPDKVINIGDSKQGGKLLQYSKKNKDTYIYIEEKRDGKKELATKTMYKQK